MKKIFLFFLLLITHCSLFIVRAQQPTLEWWARYNRGPNSGFNGDPFIGVDRFGNCYIHGLTRLDSAYLLTVKYNSSGVQQWVSLYRHPGVGFYIPQKAVVDSNGNVYAIYTVGDCAFCLWNCLTIKFSASNGQVLWAKRYNAPSSNGQSQPYDLKVDMYGNVYVVGVSDSSLLCIKYNNNGDSLWLRRYRAPSSTFDAARACVLDDSLSLMATGNTVNPNGINVNMLTIKYSTNGALRWASIFNRGNVNGPRGDGGWAADCDLNGSVYVTGQSDELNYPYTPNYATLKYDRNGVQQWVSFYKGSGSLDNFPYKIAVSKNSNYLYVTGKSTGTYNPNWYSWTTIRYNSTNGDSVWVKRYNGTAHESDAPSDLKIDSQGNAYVTGSALMTGTGYDYVTIKYLSSGTAGWTAIHNQASLDDIPTGMALDSNGNVFVTGGTYNGSGMDYLTIKYSQLQGIQPISNETPNNFKLEQNYPNPFNGKSNIKYQIAKISDGKGQTANVRVIVYDVLGREVETLVNELQKPRVYEVTIDGTNYSSGVYFYKLIADGNIIDTKKLILLK